MGLLFDDDNEDRRGRAAGPPGQGTPLAERMRPRTLADVVGPDEIHRFNKAQQDAFLPRVEAGDIVLIGATTENPSFEVNAALLSRSKVFVLQPLSEDAIASILRRAVTDRERGLPFEITTSDDA